MLHGLSRSHSAMPGEAAQVDAAARALDIGPFTLFELAYHRWYGRDVPEAQMEPVFVSYLKTQIPPPWVRQFARQILADVERGTLDPTDYGLPPHPPETLCAGELDRWTVVLYSMAVMFVFMVLPHLTPS